MFPSLNDLSKALICFCTDNDAIDKVVIGVNNAQQLKDNLSSPSVPKKVGEWPDFEIKDKSILMPYNWPKKI